MKLEELLKQITPLPIKVCGRADYSDDGIILLGDRRVACVFDELHASYLAHAANNFPKLVAALERIADACDDIGGQHLLNWRLSLKLEADKARALLAEAQEVKPRI